MSVSSYPSSPSSCEASASHGPNTYILERKEELLHYIDNQQIILRTFDQQILAPSANSILEKEKVWYDAMTNQLAEYKKELHRLRLYGDSFIITYKSQQRLISITKEGEFIFYKMRSLFPPHFHLSNFFSQLHRHSILARRHEQNPSFRSPRSLLPPLPPRFTPPCFSKKIRSADLQLRSPYLGTLSLPSCCSKENLSLFPFSCYIPFRSHHAH